MRPYVSISGLSQAWHGQTLRQHVVKPEHHTHNLALGVLTSDMMLNDGQNDHPNRYPRIRNHRQIFGQARAGVYDVVHFYTPNMSRVGAQLQRYMRESEHFPHAFQVNVAWPGLQDLSHFRDFYRQYAEEKQSRRLEVRLILQLGRDALDLVRKAPGERIAGGHLVSQLTPYIESGVIDAVLYDSSGGRGKDLDIDEAGYCLGHIRRAFGSNVVIGVAGGLTVENFYRLQPLIEEFPGLSVDVESGVRNAQDELIVEKAVEFANQAFSILCPPLL